MFGIRLNFFDIVVKIAFSASSRGFWRRFFVTKSSRFLVFWRLWAEFFGLLAKVIWLGCQKCFQVSRGDFRKKCFLKTNSSNWFVFLDLGHKNFELLAKNFRWVRQNCIQGVQRRFLSELLFLRIFSDSWLFSDCGKNILQHWFQNFRKFGKTSFYLKNKTFEENLFSQENTYFYNFFELWSKTLRSFVKRQSNRFQNLLPTIVQRMFLHKHKLIILLEKIHGY